MHPLHSCRQYWGGEGRERGGVGQVEVVGQAMKEASSFSPAACSHPHTYCPITGLGLQE